jgi:hypothetical protein
MEKIEWKFEQKYLKENIGIGKQFNEIS